MLGWSQAQLANAAKLNRSTIGDFESGTHLCHPSNLAAIRLALEEAGIEFIGEKARGVRLRKAEETV
jgi:transcriptional regulator with XRE-family HTH domain